MDMVVKTPLNPVGGKRGSVLLLQYKYRKHFFPLSPANTRTKEGTGTVQNAEQ